MSLKYIKILYLSYHSYPILFILSYLSYCQDDCDFSAVEDMTLSRVQYQVNNNKSKFLTEKMCKPSSRTILTINVCILGGKQQMDVEY